MNNKLKIPSVKIMLQELLLENATNSLGVKKINLSKLSRAIGVINLETLRRILIGVTPSDKVTLKTQKAIETYYMVIFWNKSKKD